MVQFLLKCIDEQTVVYVRKFFFLSGFFFTETGDSQDSREREGTIFYSTLPLPLAHEHSDIYLQLCMKDDYHIFLIASLVFTRWDLPPYQITIWLIDDVTLSFCLFTWWFDYSFFVTAIWDGKLAGFELVSTINLVLQAKRLTKCASHPKCLSIDTWALQKLVNWFATSMNSLVSI